MICVILLLAACSSSAPSDAGPATGSDISDGESVGTAQVESAESADDPSTSTQPANASSMVDSWTTTEAPLPSGRFRSCDDVVLYESVDAGELLLEIVALDATTGEVLYTLPIDRGWLAPGESSSPSLDCETGTVYGLTRRGQVSAHEVMDGKRRWLSQLTVERNRKCGASPCGPELGTEVIFSIEDGLALTAASIEDSRVLGSDGEGFRLYPEGDSAVDGVAALVGYQLHDRLWTMPASRISDLTGHTFTPSTGWASRDADDENVLVQSLGPTVDESKPAEQQVTAGGVLFAFEKDTGDILWARGNLLGCGYPEPLFCNYGGYTDGNYDFEDLIRVDLNTGEDVWRHPIEQRPFNYLIGDTLFLANYDEGEIVEEYQLDYETGRMIPNPPDMNYELCSIFDLSDDPDRFDASVYSSLRSEIMRWSRHDFQFPCTDAAPGTADIQPVDDADIIASEPDLLDKISHSTTSGWHIIFDGEAIRGIQLNG